MPRLIRGARRAAPGPRPEVWAVHVAGTLGPCPARQFARRLGLRLPSRSSSAPFADIRALALSAAVLGS
eukprot:15440736-Alexandrium_andersonii.AAC.1